MLYKLNIKELNEDILYIILDLLTIKDLINMIKTDKYFFKIIEKSKHIWKKFYLNSLVDKYHILSGSIHNYNPVSNSLLYLYEIQHQEKFKTRRFIDGLPILYDYDLSNLNERIKNINYPKISQHNFPFHTNTLINKQGNIEFYSYKQFNNCIVPETQYNPVIEGMTYKYIYIEKKFIKLKKVIGNKQLILCYRTPKKTFNCSCLKFQPDLYSYIFNNQNVNVYDQIMYDSVSLSSQNDFKNIIYEKWSNYNKKNNINNLCQNPRHYDLTTMNPPTECLNFKSFKKAFKINSLTNKYWERWDIFFKIKRYFKVWTKLIN